MSRRSRLFVASAKVPLAYIGVWARIQRRQQNDSDTIVAGHVRAD